MGWIKIVIDIMQLIFKPILNFIFIFHYVYNRQNKRMLQKALEQQKRYSELQANRIGDDDLYKQLRDGKF